MPQAKFRSNLTFQASAHLAVTPGAWLAALLLHSRSQLCNHPNWMQVQYVIGNLYTRQRPQKDTTVSDYVQLHAEVPAAAADGVHVLR
jgi:hypothetical protein